VHCGHWPLPQKTDDPVTQSLPASPRLPTDRVPGANASAAIAQPLGSRRFLPWETHDVADPLGGGMVRLLVNAARMVAFFLFVCKHYQTYFLKTLCFIILRNFLLFGLEGFFLLKYLSRLLDDFTHFSDQFSIRSS